MTSTRKAIHNTIRLFCKDEDVTVVRRLKKNQYDTTGIKDPKLIAEMELKRQEEEEKQKHQSGNVIELDDIDFKLAFNDDLQFDR